MEKILRPIYRLLLNTGLVRVFVNPLTKRLARTTAYYMYKSGLIPQDPINKQVVVKTKVQKVLVKTDFLPPSSNPFVPSGIKNSNLDGSLPIIVFDLTSTYKNSVYVNKIASLQQETRDFRPLFITSDPDFSSFREYGYMFEYIPRRTQWRKLNKVLSIEYVDYVDQRKLSIISFQRPLKVIHSKDIKTYTNKQISPTTLFI